MLQWGGGGRGLGSTRAWALPGFTVLSNTALGRIAGVGAEQGQVSGTAPSRSGPLVSSLSVAETSDPHEAGYKGWGHSP